VKAITQLIIFQKKKPSLLLFVMLLTIASSGFSQFQPTPVTRSNNHITVNGKDFYLHEVIKGQTLFGISKVYDVSEEEIKKINPDLNTKSVYPGMVLRIPQSDTKVNPQTTKEEGQYILHTVLPKETLFSISKQYGLKVEDLSELNPEAKSGVKTGQFLKIPRDKVAFAKKAAVTGEKTTKNAAGTEPEQNIANNDQPCKTKSFPHKNDNFRMAVLLPLNISQNDTLLYADSLKADHFRFYDFLEGVYLAVDSLQYEGLNLTLEIFDTERNPETIKRILNSGKLDGADFIIGPVFPNEIELVSAFSKSKHVPMVSPLSTFDVVRENPFAFQVRNKLPKQIELAADYIGSKYNQNIVVIGRYAERKNSDFTRFMSNLNSEVKEHDPARKATVKTIFFSEISRTFINQDSTGIDFEKYLSAANSNFIVIPSENEVFITEVVDLVHQESLTRNIHLFGLNQWVFSDLDLGNLYDLNFESYSDFEDEHPFIDYTDANVISFCRNYKNNWNIEPSKYSFQGFDISFFFTRALFQFGHNLIASVPCWPEFITQPSMLTPMRFQSVSPNGFVNQAITVVRFQKDELTRKKVN